MKHLSAAWLVMLAPALAPAGDPLKEARQALYELTQAKQPPQVGSHYHIALKASDRTYEELKSRLNAAGEPFRETDHGYCRSIYTRSPDGMILEFTCDPSDVAEIDALRRADAHSELARWLGGDRRVNNELRHRD